MQLSRINVKRRSTPSKAEILKILKTENSALSHETLQSKLSTPMDRATIYRILNRFCADGKVHKVIGDDGKQYFALCNNCKEKKTEHTHNHFHFKCLQCGKVECLKSEMKAELPPGYLLESYNGLISGKCKNCSGNT